MNTHLIIAGVIATGVTAVGVAAPAVAAPEGPRDVKTVVMQLQEAGHTVIVNRTGSQPLSQCTVTGVRAGHTYSRSDSGYPGGKLNPMGQSVGMTVYVDAVC